MTGLTLARARAGDQDAFRELTETDDAWLTMPPLPHAYQGPTAIGALLRGAEERRGTTLQLVATRANTHPAFGCYLPAPETGVARALALRPRDRRGPYIRDHMVR